MSYQTHNYENNLFLIQEVFLHRLLQKYLNYIAIKRFSIRCEKNVPAVRRQTFLIDSCVGVPVRAID